MSKTLVGFVTFGNLDFTKLAVESVIETSSYDINFMAVVGKPGDEDTAHWLKEKGIPFIWHQKNYGFPYSLNDIYDYAWKYNDYDNLIIMGNDIVCYPYAIDSLIKQAEDTEYKVISALQYDVRDLVRDFPEAEEYFSSSNYIITDLSSKVWNKFTDYSDELSVADMQLYDIQNLCLYKRSVFEEIGYTDVNFYPAYFVDNDYARRIVLAKIRCCSLVNARFFHFWSRTIHQETGGSNHKFFENNRKYYIEKWGGPFGEETKTPDLKIDSRESERIALSRWII